MSLIIVVMLLVVVVGGVAIDVVDVAMSLCYIVVTCDDNTRACCVIVLHR